MTPVCPKTVCLFSLENTLIDSDSISLDLDAFLQKKLGTEKLKKYWHSFYEIKRATGLTDYIGAMEKFHQENNNKPALFAILEFLNEYDFRKRLHPCALDVVGQSSQWVIPVLLVNDDTTFRPSILMNSGLFNAAHGNIVVGTGSELEDLEERFPAKHYVIVDSNLAFLSEAKNAFGNRVTTILIEQNIAELPCMEPRFNADYKKESIEALLGIELNRYSEG